MVMVLFLVATLLLSWYLHVIMCVAFQLIQNYYEETALFNACRCGHAETAKVLLDMGQLLTTRIR